MIELTYFFSPNDTGVLVYQIIQFSPDDSWRVVLDSELLGSIEKFNGKWKQLSGSDFSAELFNGIIELIDRQHFNHLPSSLISRWNNLIQEVVAQSDQKYLVICKAGIHFKSFEGIFSKFVSGLLKDEWPIEFQVFNHDFSDDFTVLAKPKIWKQPVVGWN